METITIEVRNQKALNLLHALEELKLIRVIKGNILREDVNLVAKYKGVFTAEDAENFEKYIRQMRSEWGDI